MSNSAYIYGPWVAILFYRGEKKEEEKRVRAASLRLVSLSAHKLT